MNRSLLRARIGAALRGRSSRLNPRGASRALRVAGVDAERMAATLSAAAPGLTLMLQLRTRAFDDAVAAASGRGVRLIVSIGSGFDDRRADARAYGRLWEVDHPPILAAKGPRAIVEQVAVSDLDADAWSELRARGAPLACERALLVVHNAALWSSRPPLGSFLPRFADEAAVGSEVLLNIPDDDDAGRGALHAVAPVSAPGGSTALLELHRRCAALGLETVAAVGTEDLQQRYLGSSDLLVREFLVWIRKNGASSDGGRAIVMDDLLGRAPFSNGGAPVSEGPVGTTTVRQASEMVRIDRPPVRVVARRAREVWAHGVAVEACLLVRRIAALLEQKQPVLLVLDVSSTEVHQPQVHALLHTGAHNQIRGGIHAHVRGGGHGDAPGPGGGLPVVRISEPQFSRQLLAHELTHVIARSQSPWLSEGVAVWTQRRVAPGPCFPDDVASGLDASRGRSLSLSEWLQHPGDLPITVRPVARRPGRSEYRRAASFVDFFLCAFGRAPLFRLFAVSGQPGFCKAAADVCRSVGCCSLDEIEARWQGWLRRRSG